ncbi:sugar O-acetyltransferase [Muribaculaceae bacterium Isolate-002 (NCI)]|nr:sugar O-acetyltransferase [Muribaculaceae bacterium Isolate-002 (NCI)]
MAKDLFELLGAGCWVYGGAKDLPEVSRRLQVCADACFKINSLRPSETGRREESLRKLLGSAGENLVINPPFRCDFGYNIHIGNNFVGNFNLTILDEARVDIGDNVMIGPNCTLVTITHAMLPGQRNDGIMRALPVKIGDNAWLASNVVVLPGVTIGESAVIGAGSVVTKSVPSHTFAAGNPCRPIRPVTELDRVEPVV